MGKPFCRKNNQGLPRWYIYVTYKGQRVRKVAGKTKTEALRYQRKWETRLERDKGASIRDKKSLSTFCAANTSSGRPTTSGSRR